jgi:hypothetical protein
LIYNELWHDIYDGDTAPTKPIDATSLEKWNLKDEKALALLHPSVTKHMFVHIEEFQICMVCLESIKESF